MSLQKLVTSKQFVNVLKQFDQVLWRKWFTHKLRSNWNELSIVIEEIKKFEFDTIKNK